MSIQRTGFLTLEGFVKTFDQSFTTEGLSHKPNAPAAFARKGTCSAGSALMKMIGLLAIGNQAILKIDPVHAGHFASR